MSVGLIAAVFVVNRSPYIAYACDCVSGEGVVGIR